MLRIVALFYLFLFLPKSLVQWPLYHICPGEPNKHADSWPCPRVSWNQLLPAHKTLVGTSVPSFVQWHHHVGSWNLPKWEHLHQEISKCPKQRFLLPLLPLFLPLPLFFLLLPPLLLPRLLLPPLPPSRKLAAEFTSAPTAPTPSLLRQKLYKGPKSMLIRVAAIQVILLLAVHFVIAAWGPWQLSGPATFAFSKPPSLFCPPHPPPLWPWRLSYLGGKCCRGYPIWWSRKTLDGAEETLI